MSTGLVVTLGPAPRTPASILTLPIVFPAVLDELTIEEEATFQDVDSAEAGEFSISVGGEGEDAPRLTRFSLAILASHAPHHALQPGPVPPDDLWDALCRIGRGKRPVHLTGLVGGDTDLDLDVTLRTWSRTTRAGQPAERYFATSWVEDRPVTVGRRTVTYLRLPTNHQIMPGDTLGKISKLYFGTPNLWREIKKANKLRNIGVRDFLRGDRYFPDGGTIFVPRIVREPGRDPRALDRGAPIAFAGSGRRPENFRI